MKETECKLAEYIFDTDIDLEATFFCGQTFLWKKEGGGYIGLVDEHIVYASHTQQRLCVQTPPNLDGPYWRRYFDLDRDYSSIAQRFHNDKNIKSAYVRYLGLRVLNQPVWETMACFIISANNNIKRIYGIVDRLCQTLGKAHTYSGSTYYTFPDAAKIADAGEEALRRLGLGYRAAYLYDTAKRVAGGYDLEALLGMGYCAALKELLTFKGIGEKVADCILLFSCAYTQAFPVDTWVKKLMRSLYGVEGGSKAIKESGNALFGDYAGLVQQMLFHGARTGLFSL